MWGWCVDGCVVSGGVWGWCVDGCVVSGGVGVVC